MKFIIELVIAAMMLFGVVYGIELALNEEMRNAILNLPQLDLTNWVIVGQAILKMAGFFWPVGVVAVILMWRAK